MVLQKMVGGAQEKAVATRACWDFQLCFVARTTTYIP
jgi:hypothetical protein